MPGQAGTLSEAANGVFVVWALVWWGSTAKQADRQRERRRRRRRGEGEQTLRPAHTVRQLNKCLPSSETERYDETGRRKMSDFLAADDGKTKCSRER